MAQYVVTDGITQFATDLDTQAEADALAAAAPVLTPTASTRNVVQPSAADKVPFTVKGFASQSADLFDWAKADDTVYLRVNKNGYLVNAKVAAPADAELAAGEVALWLDATNGAGKLMVKAKTANGTVASGSVTLS